MKKKRIIILCCVLVSVIVLALTTSYAIFTFNITKDTTFKLAIGNLELSITDTVTDDKIIMENTVPTRDETALSQDGYKFAITNTGTIDSYYAVYLDDILLEGVGDRLSNSYVKFNLLNEDTGKQSTNMLSNYPDEDRILANGFLKPGEDVTYTLRMWVDYNAGNDAQNKYFATQIRVVGTQQSAVGYKEELLNGADPVLTDNLVPIMISNDGTVTKANIQEEWYSYEKKNWANAVVLKESKTYKNGETIPESNIESYFVWIPRYSYQLWDLGNYSSLTSIDSTKPHAISIKFGLTNTSDSNTGECTTPMNEDGTQGLAGESGNCKVGDYMTHPAFLAFDTNGLWVGKFETGYDGATSKTAAQVNSSDSSKVIIKPNVYSWRGITIGKMFDVSYNYLKNDESHMMKNTEWGAVAYLSHSVYGLQGSLRSNNNRDCVTGYAGTEEPTLGYNNGTSIEGNRSESTQLGVDGTYTVNYLNTKSTVASTTGNKSGIYDMSGGSWEYVMGYTIGATTIGSSSGITAIYGDFFSNSRWNKYYDKYTSTVDINHNNRILGDATGEMGPFGSEKEPDDVTRVKTSWYMDYVEGFVSSSYSWFGRGGAFSRGTSSGAFTYYPDKGTTGVNDSFRVVLAPTK